MVTQVVDKLEVFQAAFLDFTVTDDQFLNFCIYFDVAVIEITNRINDTQPNNSCYVPLNIPLKTRHKKLN